MPALQLLLGLVLAVGLVVQPVLVEDVVHLAMVVGQAVQPWLVDRPTLAKERLVRQ